MTFKELMDVYKVELVIISYRCDNPNRYFEVKNGIPKRIRNQFNFTDHIYDNGETITYFLYYQDKIIGKWFMFGHAVHVTITTNDLII